MIRISFKVRRGDNIYDAIMKQLFEKVGKELISIFLGLTPYKIEELPREFIKIKEKKTQRSHVDFLVWVSIENKNNTNSSRPAKKMFLLHIEFQTKNDPLIHQRFVNYSFLVKEKYGEYPEQILIYLGPEKIRMKEKIQVQGRFTLFIHQCKIINLREIDPQIFLEAKSPLIQLLSIISEKQPVNITIHQLIPRLKENPSEDWNFILTVMNYLLQLRLKYRQVEKLLEEVKNLLGIKKEELVLYKEGIKEGIKKGQKNQLILGILKALSKRFSVSKNDLTDIETLLNKIDNIEQLNNLFDYAFDAESIEDFKSKLVK